MRGLWELFLINFRRKELIISLKSDCDRQRSASCRILLILPLFLINECTETVRVTDITCSRARVSHGPHIWSTDQTPGQISASLWCMRPSGRRSLVILILSNISTTPLTWPLLTFRSRSDKINNHPNFRILLDYCYLGQVGFIVFALIIQCWYVLCLPPDERVEGRKKWRVIMLGLEHNGVTPARDLLLLLSTNIQKTNIWERNSENFNIRYTLLILEDNLGKVSQEA